jgi:hypothetical protein
MHGLEPVDEPLFAGAYGAGAGVAEAVGKPQRQIARTGGVLYVDGIEDMRQRGLAHVRVGVAERAVLVALILKHIRVDGADPDAFVRRCFEHGGNILGAVGKVP